MKKKLLLAAVCFVFLALAVFGGTTYVTAGHAILLWEHEETHSSFPMDWPAPRTDNVLVAVLDTGIDSDHEALRGKVEAEVNFSDSPTPDDLYGHGTHSAGIITGIAPDCSLLNVKVADDQGRCYCRSVAQGIEWAVDHNASVINVSLCVYAPCDELEVAVNYAWQNGVIIVAAACDLVKGQSITCYPALYEQCIAVALVKDYGIPIPLMTYEDWMDFGVAGFGVYSTLPNDQYGHKSGTSPAVAYVSGRVASIMAQP